MNIFQKLYQELRKKYGKPKEQWNLWCKRPKNKKEREEVILGAILTQRTNWKNVELALNNLKNKKIVSLKNVYYRGPEKLAPLIRPAGFYKTKAQYLFNLAKFIIENYKNLERLKKTGTKELREKLLKLKGIGPETADSILLYALDKPVFVIDEYTQKLIKERNLAEKPNYHFLQQLFEKNLKKDFRLYQNFHALIVINGKNKKSKKYWSDEVTRQSNALDLEEGVFTWNDPEKIAKSLKKSAEESLRRKGTAHQSAMSMLNFYINRAGKNLKPARKRILAQAKIELRKWYNK